MRAYLLVLTLLPGCWGNESTPFPPGLEPLEDNTAPRLRPTATDSYPEGLSEVWGSNGYDWVHARGFVKAPAAVVWAALKDGDLVADKKNTDGQTVRYGTQPEYAWSYEIDYHRSEIIDVDWTEQYRFGVIEGSDEELELGMVRYQKVEGFSLIHLIEGSALVRAVDAQTSELELVKHVDAYMAGVSDIRDAFADLYAKILARAHASATRPPAPRAPSTRPAARTP